MAKIIVETKANGELVGYEGGKLYKGIPIEIGYDDLVTTEVENNDGTVTRVSAYGDYQHNSETGPPTDTPVPTENPPVYETITLEDGSKVEQEVKITIYEWELI